MTDRRDASPQGFHTRMTRGFVVFVVDYARTTGQLLLRAMSKNVIIKMFSGGVSYVTKRVTQTTQPNSVPYYYRVQYSSTIFK